VKTTTSVVAERIEMGIVVSCGRHDSGIEFARRCTRLASCVGRAKVKPSGPVSFMDRSTDEDRIIRFELTSAVEPRGRTRITA